MLNEKNKKTHGLFWHSIKQYLRPVYISDSCGEFTQSPWLPLSCAFPIWRVYAFAHPLRLNNPFVFIRFQIQHRKNTKNAIQTNLQTNSNKKTKTKK